MPRVKICSITDPDDRDAAIAAGADALGFIVDVPVDTDREISPEHAAELIADVPPFVTTTLVTMPDSVARARDLIERTGAAAVQIHNDLSPGEFRTLAETTDVTTIKRIPADDPDVASEYDEVADALLVDSVDESGAGGTGHTSDWTATRTLQDRVTSPVILAGGLDPENVASAVRTVDPYAVDVSSGVEVAEGRKDHTAIAAFIERATVTSDETDPDIPTGEVPSR
ncbi:MAG: phosphoribosylanthranilate isomerase [Halobacteriales archaeon]